MMFARELTKEERRFCEALGAAVIAWNHAEASFRTLLHYATRGYSSSDIGSRIDILLANLGNMSMAEALQAIADDFDDPVSGHLKHVAKLFDALRLYRNYYVHGAISFATTVDETTTLAIMQQITAKGGELKMHQGTVQTSELETFHERLRTLQSYVSDLLMGLLNLSETRPTPIASLEKPPLPDKLTLRRLRLIEHRRQLRS